MKRLVMITVIVLYLAGCAVGPEMPPGIGSGIHDYKPSPCACVPFYRNGQWLS